MEAFFKLKAESKATYAYKWKKGVWLMRKYTPSSLLWDECKLSSETERLDPHLLEASLKDFRKETFLPHLPKMQHVEIHWDNV